MTPPAPGGIPAHRDATAPSAKAPLPHWLTPQRLLRVSVVVALATIVLKTLAWYLTGSVGLLSDALESFVNLAGAVFALAMVTVAGMPADEGHPYGHHKAEYFSSGFEGVLIIGAALAIVWAASHRLLNPAPLEAIGWGLLLSVASSALNGLLAWALLRAARQHGSIALEADGRHLVTDVITSAGVVLGIGAVALTGWLWLDPVVAIGVALNIAWEGGKLVWRSAQGLMDEAVDPATVQAIDAALEAVRRHQARPELLRFDHLRTRRAGQQLFADLHLHVPADWTLGRAVALRAEVEAALLQAVPTLSASIQLLSSHTEAHGLAPQEETQP